jgi:conjugative relaxase-like TrwC/TraI family protein
MRGGLKMYRGSAAAARSYVEADRGRADDYYLTEGTGLGEHYVASPAEGVRLVGTLAGDAYEAWVAGRDPQTGVPKGRLRADGQAVRFVEIVINGPKSWSLAAELHPDISAAYDAAQNRAATQILAWLAQHATTRVGPRGGQMQIPVQRIDSVVVRHYTSRAGDPHRHLHLQINARVRAEDRWLGLHTVGVRDSLDAINSIGHAAVVTDPQFRAVLAGHGFTLNADGEISQLAEYVGPFSARAAQITRNLDRYEAEWRATHPGEQPGPALRRGWDARAWAENRPDKVIPASADVLRQRWLGELRDLGYRDPHRQPVSVGRHRVGELDRDRSVQIVLRRLAARRSAWNTADIRGEVEQHLARTGVVADAAVRTELAEDLTARTVAACVPLIPRSGIPEHIRALTSPHVLEVEADLVDRLAARAEHHNAIAAPAESIHDLHGMNAGQQRAVHALIGGRALVVVEGAAGAGKTATLAATRAVLQRQGQRLMVVTPTLKAATMAARQVGSSAGSAAWLVYQHGYRWDQNGRWTRLTIGDTDPHTGVRYAGPSDRASLRNEDLLVIDEAGMLDQDTARALLTLADEEGVRVGLLGDRHQLSAVGRGGVLDLAARWATPDARLMLDSVHRFTRTVTANGAPVIVADGEYAALSLRMRTGEQPGDVFDILAARGQIALYPSDAARTAALAQIAVAELAADRSMSVVADTREQAADLNATIRDQLLAAGRVDDQHTTTTTAGQRIGIGDRVTTRRNHRHLEVANRDTWIVTAVDRHGGITVTGTYGQRTLPADYVRRYVELGYANTIHAVQGDTVTTGHLVLGERTGAASVYVGMTRGRAGNTAHLIADSLDRAREQWITAFTRDRADLGPTHAADLAAGEAQRYAPHRPLQEALAELHDSWTLEQNCLDQLTSDRHLRDQLREIIAITAERATTVPPLEAAYRTARSHADQAAHQFEQVAAAVDSGTRHITDQLHSMWDSQRPVARAAAHTIRGGSGLLGRHRHAVRDARDQLRQWADTWRPIIPELPSSLDGIATVAAASFDDTTRLRDAFGRYGRHIAKRAHPDHALAWEAAESAAATVARAWAAYESAADRYEQQLWQYGTLAHVPQPRQVLDRLTQRIADTQRRLDHARADLANLTREPALRTLPADRLKAERDAWRADRIAQQRAAIAHSARTRPSTLREWPTNDSPIPPPSPTSGIRR